MVGRPVVVILQSRPCAISSVLVERRDLFTVGVPWIPGLAETKGLGLGLRMACNHIRADIQPATHTQNLEFDWPWRRR